MDFETQKNMVPLPKRGVINHKPRVYGSSVKGIPLEVFGPVDGPTDILLMAAMHGDEGESTVVLSEALRSVRSSDVKHPVILSVNPDGILYGTRCNARGVDLNRNWPTVNWSPDTVLYRGHGQEIREIELSPGSLAASEPETSALQELVQRVRPRTIISLHAPLGCVEDPETKPLARWIADRVGLPLVPDVGYMTPGSFGTWCAEQGINIITWELPLEPISDLIASHAPVLRRLITGERLPETA